MASLPIPFLSDLQLPLVGRGRAAVGTEANDPDADGGDTDHPDNRVIVGGRHGSPSIVVGLPLSDITVTERDPLTGAAVAELAGLLAALAEQVASLVAEPVGTGEDEPSDATGAPAGAVADERAVVVEEVRSRALALQRQLLAADR